LPASPDATYSYGYSSGAWGDQLTTYRGKTLTYDDLGNPLYYHNGYGFGKNFTWTGRQLTGMTQSGTTQSFTYNDEGIRTSKTVNGVTTTYYLSGSTIIAEETSGNLTVYIYDSNGSPIGMQYHGSSYAEDVWDVFWYEKNLQGDIVAVYNDAGTKLVTYYYDAFGYCIAGYDNNGSSTRAYYNPFRYRGYYYDKDLDLYYLNSRYYDGRTGRFISPDAPSYLGANGDLNSYNLYAYCSNNPVMYTDKSGCLAEWLGDLLKGVAIISATALVVTASTFHGGTALAFLTAFGKTALIGLEITAVSGTTSGAIRMGRSLVKNISEGNTFSETATNAGKSFLTGFADGFFAGAKDYMTTDLLSYCCYLGFGFLNNGYGFTNINYMALYQNPTVLGVTFFASRSGRKFRVDLDPKHSIHYHYGKTKKERDIHKGSWISGIFVGIYNGFNGDVY